MINVEIDGKTKTVGPGTKLIDILGDTECKYYAANINNKIVDLNYKITEPCKIATLTMSSFHGSKIYQASLRFVVAMAAKRLFPDLTIHFNVSVTMSYFANFTKGKRYISQKEFHQIKEEIEKIISANYPIVRKTVSKEEILKIYEQEGLTDKVELLKYKDANNFDYYECEGYKDYLYHLMVPSTGYLKRYELRLYSPGFLVRYPRADHKGEIPQWEDDKEFRKVLREANEWSHISGIEYISDLNKIIESGQALEYINLCESKFGRQLVRLVDDIEKQISHLKLICVAGPSSSGKTTFTNKVRIEMKSRGFEPLMISMDNFYLPDEKVPRDENGKIDYENIDALDLEYFDEVILKLSQGEEVQLPTWDFAGQKRTYSKPVKLEPNHPILIEGIHGLNDRIAPSIPDGDKFKIFICPLFQANIDDHTPISLTDLRLIRRAIRDYKDRGVSMEKTFFLWPSVREGEFKWIYPNQCNADFIFNTELDYEFCAYKKEATELLKTVPETSPYYTKAFQLIDFLSFFKEVSYKWIPCTSVIREFTGGSIFYTNDKV